MGKKQDLLFYIIIQCNRILIGLDWSEVKWIEPWLWWLRAGSWFDLQLFTLFVCAHWHTHTHQLQTIRYIYCMRDDEWLPHWMFYTKNSIDSRMIDNDRLSGKYENIVIRMQRANDSQCDWISANRCLVRVPASRQWELSFVRMDISTPLFSSIYAVFSCFYRFYILFPFLHTFLLFFFSLPICNHFSIHQPSCKCASFAIERVGKPIKCDNYEISLGHLEYGSS